MARKFNDAWRKKACCLGVLTIFKQALNMISAPIQILWFYRYFHKIDFRDIDKIRLDILFLI